MSQSKGKNKFEPSSHLSKEENDLIFRILGPRCQSLCTAIARVYYAEPKFRPKWMLKVPAQPICFVKDNEKRSYFIRVYSLEQKRIIWEHEIYDEIEISREKDLFLTFEGQEAAVLLLFPFIDEADLFFFESTSTVERRSRRRLEQNGPSYVNAQVARGHGAAVQTQASKVDLKSNKKGKKKKKLTRDDIGRPIADSFTHITHVGWKTGEGFDHSGSKNEVLSKFLQKAGVTEKHLKNKDTRTFIHNFIENNADAILKNENAAPPPLPARNPNMNQRARPPVPALPSERRNMRERTPVRPGKAGPMPTSRPPPPPVEGPSSGPPPPPPPQMNVDLPPPPPMGMPMARPTPAPMQCAPDPRAELLKSIQQFGGNLKKSTETQQSRAVESKSDCDLAGMLHNALSKREMAVRDSESEDDGDMIESDGEWDD